MSRSKLYAALLSLTALGASGSALAATADLASLKAELDALKAEYSQRIGALEERIGQLEQTAPSPASPDSLAAATESPTAAATVETTPAIAGSSEAAPIDSAGAPGASFGMSTSSGPSTAFNPAISMVLVGNYASLSEDPASYRFAGFLPSGGEIGPGERSFNLGESEITLAANVDPYFSASMTAALSADGEIGVEEAYFRTLALHSGFTLKGGRFFSSIGYLNEVHAHAWDFADQPLAYQAFFGGQLAQDGLQLRWVAPTLTFIELGAETGNGAQFPGTSRNRNGLSGTALFAHVGGDIGDSTSWRAGASWLDHDASDRQYDDVDELGIPVTNAFTGSSRTWVLDATMKWAPGGNSTQRQLKLQGEYLHRRERGRLAFDVAGLALDDDYSSSQSGWYVQSVYQFRPRWRAGLRYDALDSGSPRIGLVDDGLLPASAFPALLSGSPDRVTLMLDWSPSEFSRLRAQYAWDDARLFDERDRQFFLQYIYGIGAHAAHKF